MSKFRLFEPALFPSISYMAKWIGGNACWDDLSLIDRSNNSNRYSIAGPNGLQFLSIPVVRESAKGLPAGVRIDYRNHHPAKEWKALETAYRSAPFFEALAPELEEIVFSEHLFLMERQEASILWAESMMGHKNPPRIQRLSELNLDPAELPERTSKSIANLPLYPQVFTQKLGFIPDLSILDLLMNEGPASLGYLLAVGANHYISAQ